MTRTPLALLLFLFIALAGIGFTGCGGGDDDPGTTVADSVDANGDPVEIPSDDDDEGVAGESGGADDADIPDLDFEIDDLDATSVEVEPGSYKFRLKVKEGDTYGYRMIRTQTLESGVLATKQKQTYDVTMKVLERKQNGAILLGVTYDRVRAEITAPQFQADSTGRAPLLDSTGQPIIENKTVRFDTRNKTRVPGAEQFRAYIGKQVVVATDRVGQVIGVENVDPIYKAMLSHLKVNPDTVDAKLLDMTKQGIGVEISLLVQQIFFTNVPREPVEEGEDWTLSDTVEVGKRREVTSIVYRLASVSTGGDEPSATIKAQLKSAPRVPKEPMEVNGISVKVKNLRVSGNGTSTLSLVTGFPVKRSSTISSKLTGTGTATEGPRAGESEPITRTESTRTSVTRTSYKAGS